MRRRRRKRTGAFQRQLMVRQVGSSPLIFERVTPPPSSYDGGDGYREYNSDLDNGNMMEAGTVTQTDPSHVQSIYSEQSLQSIYSDSPDIFYTAIPRSIGMNPPPTPPPSLPLPPPPIPTHSSPTSNSAPPPHPQLAPGWVFPRAPVRASQLPPPKTDRQMDIYDRKVRLQGKLIGMQGWGNGEVSESQKLETATLKDQIHRLELLENSDWALGKSNDPPLLS